MPKDRYQDRILDGRYHLTRLLDSGSFGGVYEAKDQKLGRTVAVKILFEQDETAFRKEAQLAVQFEHPNVVKVFDYGADDELGVGYIVMEFLKGMRLDQMIDGMNGRVPFPVIAQFVDEIGSALELAHDRQLIHRDLKPRNVMLVDDGTSQERFVLLDLGLASQTNATSTLRNQTFDGALSPQYASPEQFGQSVVDYRSDIYSFGTILFELVTGQVPFLREQLPAMMLAITTEPPPSLKDIAPDRDPPAALEEVVRLCLEKTPTGRPHHIREVRSEVLKVLPRGDVRFNIASSVASKSDTNVNHPTVIEADRSNAGTLLPPGADTSDAAGSVEQASVETSSPAWRPARSRRAQADKTRSQTSGTGAAAWKRRSTSSRRVAAAIVVAMLSLAGWIFLPNLFEGTVSTVPGKLVLPEGVMLQTGRSFGLQTYIEPPPESDGAEIKLMIGQCPDWVQVSLPAAMPVAQMFEIDLVAGEAAMTAQTGQLTLTLSGNDWSIEKTVRLTLQALPIWSLPAEFHPAAGSAVIASDTDQRSYYQRIERTVRSDLVVGFVLIDPPQSDSGKRDLSPFYVMENKVWNELFEVYWQSVGRTADLADDSWLQGATAAGNDLPALDNPTLPTVRVTPRQAHHFAQWLASDPGHLPSYDQWNAASGVEHWRRADDALRVEYPDGPYRVPNDGKQLRVAVNLRASGPRPVGTSADDVTLTGLHDIAGNGMELTESILQQPSLRLGDLVGDDLRSGQFRVHLRGRSYQSARPLSWSEIEETAEYPEAIGYTEVDPVVGFRVVLDTAD